ncbi:MAG: hypothetical protein ABID09_01325 [Candidatus Omnitrophota bacterium]
MAIDGISAIISRLPLGGHAICAFEKDGRYLWFDNGKLKETNEASLEDFTSYIIAKYKCSSVSEIYFDSKERKVLARQEKTEGGLANE